MYTFPMFGDIGADILSFKKDEDEEYKPDDQGAVVDLTKVSFVIVVWPPAFLSVPRRQVKWSC